MSELEAEPVAPAEEPDETSEIAEQETADEAVEETAASDDADSESDDSEEPEKPKRRSRAEERINALTREKYEAQKQAEEYQRRVAEYEQFLSQQQRAQQLGQIGQQMPTLADFNYDETQYQAAVAQWSQQQVAAYQQQQEEQTKQQQYQRAQEQEMQHLQQKVQEGIAKYPDFQQKVFDPSLPPLRQVNPTAFQAVMESEAGIDIAYYLASNPQEVYAFASMSPVQAIKAVTQLENKLAAKPQSSPKVPPKPPSKVSGKSGAGDVNPQKMSTEEFIRWRNSQLAKKR